MSCDNCTRRFSDKLQYERFHVPLKHIGTINPLPPLDSACSFCRFLAQIYGDSEIKNHQAYYLCAVSCLRYYALGSISIHFAEPNIQDRNFWVLLPCSQALSKYSHEAIRNIIQRAGCFALLDPPYEVGEELRYKVQAVDRLTADFDLLRGWLSFCGENHNSLCLANKSSLPNGFAVIDCTTRTICELPKGSEFFALSYVWGSRSASTTPTPSTTNHVDGESHGTLEELNRAMMNFGSNSLPTIPRSEPTRSQSHLPSDMPRVVHDAIIVTQELGFRYLWIDRYCISSDVAVKHEQIQNMDRIYRSAYATIIAAAGEDPSFGLPGVSIRNRKPQPRASIGCKTLVSCLPDPGVAIKNSKWNTRAWTYQECLLSTRRIFFTEEQMYFECQTMHCREAVREPLEALHTPDKTRLRVSMRPGLYPRHGLGRSPNDIWDRIVEYTKRSMTYETDALNGMLGLLRTFRELERPIYHIWGIPFFRSRDGRFLKYKSNLDIFIASLCWDLVEPAKRRLEFPSWSWAGWSKPVHCTYPRVLLNRSFKVAEGLKLSFSDLLTTNVHDWDKVVHDIKADKPMPYLGKELQVEAATIRIPLIYRSGTEVDHDNKKNNYGRRWISTLTSPGRKAKAVRRDMLRMCKDLAADLGSHKIEYEEYYKGIILGTSNNNKGNEEVVMLIVDEDMTRRRAERIGFLFLDEKHVKGMPKWRTTTNIV